MASLWIINKAGGLIYNVDYTGGAAPAPAASSSGLATLSSNDYLILAGTLHGIHAITSRLSPRMAVQQQYPQGVQPQVQDTGLQQLQANGFDMNVMATATGIKLVLLTPTSRPGGSNASATPARLLQRSYAAYAEHVMKNPFYTAEMPIRIESFDRAVKGILS